MNYTVSDFYKTFENGLKLIAGAGGMSRTVTSAGILDYEMESVLKDKYMHTNFRENQLVISTFLYAKNNPFSLLDAVKHLVSKNVSGLVIKNVFRLPIHESLLRYADSKNFPVFLLEAQDIYIENIIYEVSRHCELLQDARFSQKKLAHILSGDLSENEIAAQVKQLSPSCANQFFNLYIKFGDQLSNADFDTYDKRFAASSLNVPGNFLLLSEYGLFYTHSQENIASVYTDVLFQHILDVLLQQDSYSSCGVSQYHLRLEEYKMSLQESLYSADIADADGQPFIKYTELGIRRILYPFASSREMQRYAKDILSPVEDYDIENTSTLMGTLRTYLHVDCNLPAAAESLGQHKNTIRYRLDKIHELTGLDYKKFSHLEQLSAAMKIRPLNTEK